jgi:hypothetical protein
VLALQVHPSPSRPHHLIQERPATGVYVRVGSTNRRANAELIEELRRFARGEGFDEQPMPGLDSEALDFRASSESFAPQRKLARCSGWLRAVPRGTRMVTELHASHALGRRSRTSGDRVTGGWAPNMPMKLTVACGARSLSAEH